MRPRRAPLSDVHGHVVLTALGPNGITGALQQRAAVVARDSAAAIIGAFKPRYAELGRLLAEDHATLTAAGVTDLDHARLSVRAGTEPARAHARALETISTLSMIDNALDQLRALGGADGTPVGRVVRIVDAPGVAASELRRLGLNPSAWEIVGRGWTLDLATPRRQRSGTRARTTSRQATTEPSSRPTATPSGPGTAARSPSPSEPGGQGLLRRGPCPHRW